MTSPGNSRVCVNVTAAALALSVALEVSGPARSLLFSLRLPVVILVLGAAWAEARWRWGGDSSRQSVPMATPCLLVSATALAAAVTVKLVSVSPVLAFAVMGAASALCCGMACLLIAGERHGERFARSHQRGDSSALTALPRAAAAP